MPKSGPKSWAITIFSCYNRALDHHQRSLADYSALFDNPDSRSLIMGDFNLHNPTWDPFRTFSHNELRLTTPLVDQASHNGFSLVSPVAFHTFHLNNRSHCPSVLDLAFASSPLLPLVSDLCVLDPTGSDHLPLAVFLHIAYPKTPRSQPAPNWKKFDIEKTLPYLQAITIDPSPANPEKWVTSTLNQLQTVLSRSVPLRKASKWSKPWWSEDLSAMRSDSHAVSRLYQSRQSSLDAVTATKRTYFRTIKSANAAHWRNFLESTSSEELWAAKRFRDPPPPTSLPRVPNATTPDDLARGLVRSLFPAPPPSTHTPLPPPSHSHCHENVPPVLPIEVTMILEKTSSRSCPGPDSVPYSVWKAVHKAVPNLIPYILTTCLQFCFHPTCLKSSNDFVLPKTGKSDYTTP